MPSSAQNQVGERSGTPPRSGSSLSILAGVTEFQVSDGEVRRLGPGTILLAEDTVGRGHVSEVVGAADVKAVVIQVKGKYE